MAAVCTYPFEGFHLKIRKWFCFQLGIPAYGLLRDDHGTISRQLGASSTVKAKRKCYLDENSRYYS